MKIATTIARLPNSQLKLAMTQASAVVPVSESDPGAAKPQTTTAAVRAPATARTVRLMVKERPVLSTPMPGMSAGCTGSSRVLVRRLRVMLLARSRGPAVGPRP